MASFWEIQRVGTGELLDDMHTYVSQPDAPGRRPAVIVIQEIFGVSPHIGHSKNTTPFPAECRPVFR